MKDWACIRVRTCSFPSRVIGRLLYGRKYEGQVWHTGKSPLMTDACNLHDQVRGVSVIVSPGILGVNVFPNSPEADANQQAVMEIAQVLGGKRNTPEVLTAEQWARECAEEDERVNG